MARRPKNLMTVSLYRSASIPTFQNSTVQKNDFLRLLQNTPNEKLFFNTVVSSSLASHILTTFGFSRQRKLNKKHVEHLKRVMVNDDFDNTSPVVFGVFNNKMVCVDGQHRLTALSQLKNHSIILPVVITNDQAVDLYSHIDVGVARSSLALVSAQDDWADYGLTKHVAQTMAACRLIHVNKFSHVKHINNRELADTVRKYIPHKLHFEKVIQDQNINGALTGRGSLTSAMLMYAHIEEKYHDKIDSFWYGVATGGGGFYMNDPRLILRNNYIKGRRAVGWSASGAKSIGNEIKTIFAIWRAHARGNKKGNVSPVNIEKWFGLSPNLYLSDMVFFRD